MEGPPGRHHADRGGAPSLKYRQAFQECGRQPRERGEAGINFCREASINTLSK